MIPLTHTPKPVIPHDFNKDAIASLKANGWHNAQEGDVRDIDWSRYSTSDVKVLEGGPPCQPFSQSHDGDGQYDPRDMIPEFLRAIDGLHPELFVMEEVQTLTWKKHRVYFERVLSDMRALGYAVDWKIVDSSDFGIGQKRKRLIVIGRRLDIALNDWNIDANSGVFWPAKCPEFARTTMAEALGWTRETCTDRNRQVPDERAVVPYGDERCMWPMTRASVTVVGSFRPEVMAAPGYRKAGDPPRQGTPGSVVCTLEERLILQDFPKDWIVCGNEASQALQVGNSVPVGMMRALIEANL